MKAESLRSDASSFLAALPKGNRRCRRQLDKRLFSTITGAWRSRPAAQSALLDAPVVGTPGSGEAGDLNSYPRRA